MATTNISNQFYGDRIELQLHHDDFGLPEQGTLPREYDVLLHVRLTPKNAADTSNDAAKVQTVTVEVEG